jgi:signal peptidase II
LHGVQAERGTTLRKSAPHRAAVKSLVVVALVVVALDSASKSLALRTLTTDPKQIIGSLLQLQLTSNPGAAFGLAGSTTVFLSLLSFVAIAALYIFSRSLTSISWGIALGFLLGGICGNVIDRTFRAPYLLRGQVIDWIKLPHWPIFNLADTSIVVSATTIAFLLMNDVKPRSRHDIS